MNRIERKFTELKNQGQRAFIAYLTAGFPDPETNLRLVQELERRGADIIELGVPFSDPIADGPIIQAAGQAALKRGMTLDGVISLAAAIRQVSTIPVVLMGYLNPFISRPPARLTRQLAAAGVDGVIIPDLPPEAAEPLRLPLRQAGIHTIFLLAPNSPTERIKLAAEHGEGFLYLVSRSGVTGSTGEISRAMETKVREIKRFTELPIAVGFGISERKQLERVWRVADGAIVGSALIEPFLKTRSVQSGLARCRSLLDELLPTREE